MLINLPLGPLRSLLTIAELGSVTRAADRVFLTQSALSLQMKRLEELVQAPVFSRHGKTLALTTAGEKLLVYAKQILALNDNAVAALAPETFDGPVRIGVVQDLAETLLSGLLARFVQANPTIQLQLRVEGSADMREMVRSDALDFALCLAPAGSSMAIKESPMLWIGHDTLFDQHVLPLALLAEPCIFRSAALDALEAAGRRYRLMLDTPNLAALQAAVQSGIAATCRAQLGLGAGLGTIRRDLPPLPSVCCVIHARRPMAPAVKCLYDLTVAMLSDIVAIETNENDVVQSRA